MQRKGLHTIVSALTLLVSAGVAAAQTPETDDPPAPPAARPQTPATPLQIQTIAPLETPRATVGKIEPLLKLDKPKVSLAPPKKKPQTVLAGRPTQARPSAYAASSQTTIGSAQELMALKRSARDKTFVPTELDKTLQNWDRASPKSISAWDKPGLWTKRDVWENPSTWKGASLDKTQTTLTSLRGRTKSWAERHPLQATYGTRPTGKR